MIALQTSLILVSMAVPAVGAFVLRRTYRTDPALSGLTVPSVSIAALLGAAVVSAAIFCFAPMVGWSMAASIAAAPIFGMAFLCDARGRVLPDLLSAALAVAGVILSATGIGLPLLQALAGAALMALFLGSFRALAVRRLGEDAFGLGDLKFIVASATIVPAAQLAAAFVAAAPLSLLFLLVSPKGAVDRSLPFGSIIIAGLALLITAGATLPGFTHSTAFFWSLGF